MSEHRAGQLGDALEAPCLAPFLQPVDDRDHPRGVAEVEVAHLDSSRAREQVLHDIFGFHDPPAADEPDLYALRTLVHLAQDDALHPPARPAPAALTDRAA